MKTSDFYFDLPPERIAQTPLANRDRSRLMTLDRETGKTGHLFFYELPGLLCAGDCLVLNDTRVLPARLLGHREPGGGAAELVLLNDRGSGLWECLSRPGRKIRRGTLLSFGNGILKARVEDELPEGNRLVRFSHDGIFLEVLSMLGTMPLPPYIRAKLKDPERYQTVYSREPGSAAAPTAGLHFTRELLDRLELRGIRLAYVTLHVGLGTFRPVKTEDATRHHMHAEYCLIPAETARRVNETRAGGGRVICVGTTSCRTLESWAAEDGSIREASGWTDIFIYPGYRFKATDGLITNFHLPESTLIMLVSAFAGKEHTLEAYRRAVEAGYRFFSFGDAMMIL